MIKIVTGISLLLVFALPVLETNRAFAEIHLIPGAQKRKAPATITMWSIVKKRKSYLLTKRVVSRQSVDKIFADNGPGFWVEPLMKGDKSLLLPKNGSSIVSFAGIGEFQPGAIFVRVFPNALVNTFNSPPAKVPMTSSLSFELNNLNYKLSAAVAGSTDGWDMQVYLRQGRKKQLLYSSRQGSDAVAALEWTADIDRDGRPDFLLFTADHHAAVTSTLYLSSRAKPGAFVRAVARFHQGD